MPSSLYALLAFAAFFVVNDFASVQAQQVDKPPEIPVLVLGTYHFANPNLDHIKTNFDDHMSEQRQGEIKQVTELLAKFAPTKIAVETPAGNPNLQRDFNSYLQAERELRVNESEQLGMRLAKMLGHKQVFGVDSKLDLEFGELMAAAQREEHADLRVFIGESMVQIQELQRRVEKMTVRDALVAMNDPKLLPLGKDFYLRLTVVRDGEQYVGADQVARWYQRNFRIFANLSAMIDSPDDRVLLIIGSGHCPILRELVESDRRLQLAEPLDFLLKN